MCFLRGCLQSLVLLSNVILLAANVSHAAETPGGSFTIPSYAFDRGNVKTFNKQWAYAGPMIAYGGMLPVKVAYDIDFPVAAKYTISIKYATADARPVEMLLDETHIATSCRTATGGFNTSQAQWEQSCKLWINAGRHTLRLRCKGAFPHVFSLRFDCEAPFPKDWKLHRPRAKNLNSPSAKELSGLLSTNVKVPALRLAIEDMIDSFGSAYPHGGEYLHRLDVLERQAKRLQDAKSKVGSDLQTQRKQVAEDLVSLRREALLANPLLDFDELLLVVRGNKSPSLGLPRNWESNSSLPKTGYDDRIAVLTKLSPDGQLRTLYKPKAGRFVGDVDLHFDGDRMLFSVPGDNGRWQVFQIGTDGKGLRQLTGQEPDVDSYDACYLPDGKVIFTSTACFVGVPCVYGSSHVAVLYVMDADGRNIRQLCFDQEHDWCPVVMNNGRVMYLRWEYTDTPHSHTRLLFHMNPDGTEQMEYYGSNSYWPNSTFFARPIPGHATKVVGVVGGHHDNPRMGELVVFDPAKGRRESAGAVQRIPGRGQRVETIVSDGLTLSSWPKFLHPYPLSEKYFLVSCKPSPESLWGVYLVDVFDNMLLLKELSDHALFEPIPLRPTPRPPVIPEKVDLDRKDAVVYLSDIYAGDGLKGVPRGTVKSMRIFTYHYAYQDMGGLLGVVGMDGPWDIKRVLGIVPVNEDGSAKFRIPANMPVSLQPLDTEGKALQLMRSWMTAMPGEVVQCAGCHEQQNTAPPRTETMALNRPPDEIQPWHGPLRGFSYAREVQPVIDKYCVGCHNGEPRSDGSKICDLRGTVKLTDWSSVTPGNGGKHAGKFSLGYAELHRFVRRPGIESDYHMLEPMEFHADTTQLVQMLQQGHYGVELDAEAWDRLITWIDLNCPYHGTWGEEIDNPGRQRQRRRELLKLYANLEDDPEAVPQVAAKPVTPLLPEKTSARETSEVAKLDCPGWPFDAAEARRRQQAVGHVTKSRVDLGGGVGMDLVLVPAGQYVARRARGALGERGAQRVAIEKPFWLGAYEVTNQQFAQFHPAHDSRVETKNAYQFGVHGYPMNRPWQPVVRVSWQEAQAFCDWLSDKTGRRFRLPTEDQWEYACRAGTNTPLSYGDLDTDFSKFANVSDAKMSEFASDPFTVDTPLVKPTKYDDWIPKDARFNDGILLSARPGSFQPNAWGLFDMHGNVAEWTQTDYELDPNRTITDSASVELQVVRGGSWRDRPKRCTSSFRLGYRPYQRVYNVGFRVMCEEP